MTFLAPAVLQVSLAQNNPYAKVAYFVFGDLILPPFSILLDVNKWKVLRPFWWIKTFKLLTVYFLCVLVHLVDIWNMIEAFRDNGLNTLDHSTEISVSRLETVISSLYYQLNKRLPSTHQISVEQSISLLLNFMIAAYDRLVPCMLTSF